MISGIGSASVLVNDAKKSAEWYREKLEFEIVSNDGHSVFVKPKGSDGLLLHLCGRCDACEDDHPGGRTGIWLSCGKISMRKDEKSGKLVPASEPENVEKTYLELKGRGVAFSEELTITSWGKYAIFRDLDGNEFEIS